MVLIFVAMGHQLKVHLMPCTSLTLVQFQHWGASPVLSGAAEDAAQVRAKVVPVVAQLVEMAA